MRVSFFRIFSLLISFWLIQVSGLWAQCTQCKQAAAARDEAGNLYVGAGMNMGVLYLLALPFLLVLLVGGYWLYRTRQLRQEQLTYSAQNSVETPSGQ